MANPEMWKLVERTHCNFGGDLRPEEMYDDQDDAVQVEAGEEDQSVDGWDGA